MRARGKPTYRAVQAGRGPDPRAPAAPEMGVDQGRDRASAGEARPANDRVDGRRRRPDGVQQAPSGGPAVIDSGLKPGEAQAVYISSAATGGAAALRESDVRKSRATSAAHLPTQASPPAIAHTDEDLVREVLAGNKGLFEELVRRHQRQIVNFIYRMVGDIDLALDMSQEVFIRVYQALDRFDPKYKFTTWIYRIASNCAIDRLRRRQPPTISLDAPQPSSDRVRRIQIAAEGQNPAESFESRETMQRLEEAIHQLPSDYRRLIVLRHVNSLRYEQIAAVTGLPLGTVKNRIFRARALLRQTIERPAPERGAALRTQRSEA